MSRADRRKDAIGHIKAPVSCAEIQIFLTAPVKIAAAADEESVLLGQAAQLSCVIGPVARVIDFDPFKTCLAKS